MKDSTGIPLQAVVTTTMKDNPGTAGTLLKTMAQSGGKVARLTMNTTLPTTVTPTLHSGDATQTWMKITVVSRSFRNF